MHIWSLGTWITALWKLNSLGKVMNVYFEYLPKNDLIMCMCYSEYLLCRHMMFIVSKDSWFNRSCLIMDY